MFEKLLSALPYNPSLIHQLSFYAKRMKQEKSVRRIGLVFIALAFLIQFFAFISPPQPTLADSPNDLVNGGFSSAAEAASDCNSNLQGYGTILANYGITCAKVASAPTITITSTEFGRALYSMGRLPDNNLAGETTTTIAGVNYYYRYLWAWDSPGTTSTYQALNVTSTGGQTFLLLYPCGNLTSIGPPVAATQPPQLTISKTTTPGNYPVAGSTVAPDTALFFRVNFGNQGGAATNVQVSDPDPANATPIWQGSGAATSYNINSSHTAVWNYSTLPAGATGYYVDVEEKVNPGVPNGTHICNVATIQSSQTGPQSSNAVCMTVETPTTVTPPTTTVTPPTITPPTITPPATCPQDSSILLSSSLCQVCPTNSSIIVTNSMCKSCEEALSSEDDTACIVPAKTVSNVTQGITDANNKPANPGDVIQYTISADNSGKDTVKNYEFEDNLSYVLDYACLAVNGTCITGTTDGNATLGSNNELTWPAQDISPGQTVSEQFEVKVDSPIPQTPTSTSDPNYFNLIMSNTFGNTVTTPLPPTPIKTLETANTTLVNTGPGTSIFFGAVVVAVAGFFYYRSRLLYKESTIAVKETISGGL